MDFGIMGIIDIIVVLVLILFVLIGVKFGFLNNVANIVSKFCGFFIALIFSPSLGRFINNHFFDEGKIHDNIYAAVDGKVSSILNDEATLDSVVDSLGFPSIIDNYIKSGIKNYDATSIVNEITSRITYVFAVIIAFLILFIGIRIVCFIIKKLSEKTKKEPALSTIDSLLGGVFCFIVGMVVIYMLLLIVTEISNIPKLSGFREFLVIDMQLESTEFRLSKYINDNNVIRTIYGILTGR